MLATRLGGTEEEAFEDGGWAPIGRQFYTRLYRLTGAASARRLVPLGEDYLPPAYPEARPRQSAPGDER